MQKKTLFLFLCSLAIAASIFSGCRKEEPKPDPRPAALEVSASIESGAKVAINETTEEITLAWETGDVICGFWMDKGSTQLLSYKVGSVDQTSGAAKMTRESGTEPTADGTSVHMLLAPGRCCTSFNGGEATADISVQDGTLQGVKNNMILCATAQVENNKLHFKFTQQTALIDIKAFKVDGGKDINPCGLFITGTGISKGTVKVVNGTLTLVPENAKSSIFAQAPASGALWMTIFPAESHTLNFHANGGGKMALDKTLSRKFSAGECVDVNSLTFNEDRDLLSGLFSINDNGDKIRFSRGNLRATKSGGSITSWSTPANQYDHLSQNTSTMNVESDGTFDLFGWSGNVNNDFGLNESDEPADYTGTFKDWGSQFGTGYRTLTQSEFEYILSGGTDSTRPEGDSWRFIKARITTSDGKNVNGLFLLPDNFTAPSGISLSGKNSKRAEFDENGGNCLSYTDFTKMEDAGAVFLPAAGRRRGKGVSDQGNCGTYWVTYNQDNVNTYDLIFSNSESSLAGSAKVEIEGVRGEPDESPSKDSLDGSVNGSVDRSVGRSVRLAKSVE